MPGLRLDHRDHSAWEKARPPGQSCATARTVFTTPRSESLRVRCGSVAPARRGNRVKIERRREPSRIRRAPVSTTNGGRNTDSQLLPYRPRKPRKRQHEPGKRHERRSMARYGLGAYRVKYRGGGDDPQDSCAGQPERESHDANEKPSSSRESAWNSRDPSSCQIGVRLNRVMNPVSSAIASQMGAPVRK